MTRHRTLLLLLLMPGLLLLAAAGIQAAQGLGGYSPSQTSQTTELVRTPGGTYGWVPLLGRWERVNHDAYPGCYSANNCPSYLTYAPDTGPYAYWWTPGYNDNAWSDDAWSAWESDWDDYGWSPIPTIGKYVYRAKVPLSNGVTDLHRREFTLTTPAGYVLDHVEVQVFSDNHSEWYINGDHLHTQDASQWAFFDLPAGPFVEGSNLLAVAFHNDNVCVNCNPMGIQYVLTAVFQQLPTPTPTPYVQAYARNPQGQAVNVASLGRSRFQAGGAGEAQVIADASAYTEAAMDYGSYTYRGAYFDGYDDQVLMGVTPSANGQQANTVGNNFHYGWANWHTGGRSVVAVYATATPTPTPTPWLDAHVRNPQGTPVAQTVCRARFNSSGSPSYNTCQTTADYQSAPMAYGSYTYRGAMVVPSGNRVVVGVTPAPASGARRDLSGATLYGWSGWNTGERDVTFVVAGSPQTATPAPEIVVQAINPEGTPVAVSRAGSVRFNDGPGAWIWDYDTNTFDYSGPAPPYGAYDNRGAYFRPNANQVFLGATPMPAIAGTTHIDAPDVYYGWPDWHAGDRVVYGVFATPTPTPTPTNTPTPTPSPTPSPTPTNTPTPTPTNTPTFTPTPPPYVLPPEIRPFLHLRGHEPPYTTQQIDYLATDDVYHYAQVYLHAVPSAETVTPPRYCEWNGAGWTCTPADTFEWLGYTFSGVRREGYWFPSPVGEVTKSYSVPDHTFDPDPRWTDPDYAYPREFLHLYFNLPAGSTPPCPVSGPDGPCIVYDGRAPGEETLVATLHTRATWLSFSITRDFDLATEYPLILTATQWEYP